MAVAKEYGTIRARDIRVDNIYRANQTESIFDNFETHDLSADTVGVSYYRNHMKRILAAAEAGQVADNLSTGNLHAYIVDGKITLNPKEVHDSCAGAVQFYDETIETDTTPPSNDEDDVYSGISARIDYSAIIALLVNEIHKINSGGSMITMGTTDMTPGVTPLGTGRIHLVYEPASSTSSQS